MTPVLWTVALAVLVMLWPLAVAYRYRPELLRRLRLRVVAGAELPQDTVHRTPAPFGGGHMVALPSPGDSGDLDLAGLRELFVLVPRDLLDLEPTLLRLWVDLASREQWHKDGSRTPYLGPLDELRRSWPRTEANVRAGKPGISEGWLKICVRSLLLRGALRQVEYVLPDGRRLSAMRTVLPSERENPQQATLPHTQPLQSPVDLESRSTDLQPEFANSPARSVDLGSRSTDLQIETPHLQMPPPHLQISPQSGPGPLPGTGGIAIDVDRIVSYRIDVDERACARGEQAGSASPSPGVPMPPAEPTRPEASRADDDALAADNAAMHHNVGGRTACDGRIASSGPALNLPPLTDRQKLEYKQECDRRRDAGLQVMFATPEIRRRYPALCKKFGVLQISHPEAEELGGIVDHSKRRPHEPYAFLFASEEACLTARGQSSHDEPELPFEAAPMSAAPPRPEAPSPAPQPQQHQAKKEPSADEGGGRFMMLEVHDNTDSVVALWPRALDHLQRCQCGKGCPKATCSKALSSKNLEMWFSHMTASRDSSGGGLLLLGPNKYIADWFRTHYFDMVLSALREVGLEGGLRLLVEESREAGGTG